MYFPLKIMKTINHPTLPSIQNRFKIIKEVSPKEFLDLVKTKPGSIKSSKVVPPVLGSSSLGKIVVELRNER